MALRKKVISLGLFILGGALVLASGGGMTGAVTGLGSGSSGMTVLIGIFMIISAVVIIGLTGEGKTEYRTLTNAELEKRIGQDAILVFDTSGILKLGRQLIPLVQDYRPDQIVVPAAVYVEAFLKKDDELDRRMKQISARSPVVEGNYNKYVKEPDVKRVFSPTGKLRTFVDIAEKYIERTDKVKFFREHIKDVSLRANGAGAYLSRVEENQIYGRISEEIRIKTGTDISHLPDRERFLRIRNHLFSNYAPSKADAEVLGFALMKADEILKQDTLEKKVGENGLPRHVKIIGHDEHIEQARTLMANGQALSGVNSAEAAKYVNAARLIEIVVPVEKRDAIDSDQKMHLPRTGMSFAH